ncbi:MAG: hypothetical protein QNI98_01015 [Woeseiaceae bacterium]|nr:hypothetical protein [Woeseiaceae bacterium]
MTAQSLFFIAFAGQILLISMVFPQTIVRRMTHVLDNYPPSTHPRLYPRPLEHYEGKRSTYRTLNYVIVAIGIAAFVALTTVDFNRKTFGNTAFWYFLLQIVPMLWIEHTLRAELKLMRELNTRSTRSADLSPRRLFDVMSPALFWSIVVVYLGFWVFVTWFRQFDYPWFGGYQNNLIITAMNVFFASILGWQLYGKKLNPHQTDEDRMRHTRRIAMLLGLVSIAATLYAVMTILLSAAEYREFQPFARSVYFQVIAFMSFQVYRLDDANFDVYREDARAT